MRIARLSLLPKGYALPSFCSSVLTRVGPLMFLFLAGAWLSGSGAKLLASEATVTDPRSHEVLRYRCESSLQWSEVTLFGNGTVRLRGEESVDAESSGFSYSAGRASGVKMQLAELTPGEFDAYVARLKNESLKEVSLQRGVPGDWVNTCLLVLHLEGEERQEFRFGRLDSLSLTLSRVVGIAEELADRPDLQLANRRLGLDYLPTAGDRLKDLQGEVYEVVRFDLQGSGVELRHTRQPLTLYVSLAQLTDSFVELLSRNP